MSLLCQEIDWLRCIPWCLLLLAVLYYAVELVITQRLARKPFPLVGRSSTLVPRSMLNLKFAFRASAVLHRGYEKYKRRAFQLIRNDGNVIVLPLDVVSELSALPPSVASPHGGLEHDLLGPQTGLNLILKTRMHHSIVQRKLTHGLDALTPKLEQELNATLRDEFPLCDEWTTIRPYQLLAKISARLSARTFCGALLCRDPEWLDISKNYVESLFHTIVILRLFPTWLHPILCHILPSYWKCNAYVRAASAQLEPVFDELLRTGVSSQWMPDREEDDNHGLAWLTDMSKGSERDPRLLAHVEVLLVLASVHTVLLRMVNVLYDVVNHPQLIDHIRAEINDAETKGWSPLSYSSLGKLDSIIRESQRMSPPTTLGMKRIFRQAYTFENGIHVPKDSYVCVATYEIENDHKHNPDPDVFDGLRNERLRQRPGEADMHWFTSLEPTALNFGYGKSACPGRFFAGRVLKMLFVKLLSEFDFEFIPGLGRPKNLEIHEFLFPWPWDELRIRKRAGEVAPF